MASDGSPSPPPEHTHTLSRSSSQNVVSKDISEFPADRIGTYMNRSPTVKGLDLVAAAAAAAAGVGFATAITTSPCGKPRARACELLVVAVHRAMPALTATAADRACWRCQRRVGRCHPSRAASRTSAPPCKVWRGQGRHYKASKAKPDMARGSGSAPVCTPPPPALGWLATPGWHQLIQRVLHSIQAEHLQEASE